MQNKITEKTTVLNEDGDLMQKGYSTSLVMDYDRTQIRASKMRIKEWDYYAVINSNFCLCMTIADNGYMGMGSLTFLNFDKKEYHTKTHIKPFPMGKLALPATSVHGDVAYPAKKMNLAFLNDGKQRVLKADCPNFWDGKALSAEIVLSEVPRDSMVIATPFEKPKAFYYNQKINCLAAAGTCRIGDEVFTFDRENGSLGVLDWGRGVWTYQNTWYWGSLSTRLADGKTFGFNIGYGFGDTSAASENMLFYDGVAHKLEDVTFHIPQKEGKDDYLADWKFTSSDGRLELAFKPVLDRADKLNVGIICTDPHQVFGLFSGYAVLDDGTKIEIANAMGFAEKVYMKY